MSKSTDLNIIKHDQLLFLGDFNAGVEDSSVKNLYSSYNLASMINRPICFTNPEKPSTDLPSLVHAKSWDFLNFFQKTLKFSEKPWENWY